MEKKHFLLIVAVLVLISAIFLRIKTKIDDQNALSKIEKNTIASVAMIDDSVGATSSNSLVTEPEESYFENANENEVLIMSPQSGSLISSPLLVRGKLAGTWFFEASLPIKLVDLNGNTIAEHYALAEEDWMTEKLIAFSGQLEFTLTATTSDQGYLIVAKDNPSGLPENAGFIKMPVRFR